MAVTTKNDILSIFRLALVRNDVSERHITSTIRMTRIGELGTFTANVFPGSLILSTLIIEAIRSSEAQILT
jgi:hypothetical protein